jgi:hypothetical protein
LILYSSTAKAACFLSSESRGVMKLSKEAIFASSLAEHETHWLEIRCCGGLVQYPIRLLLQRRVKGTVAEVVRRLKCKKCGNPPHEISMADRPDQCTMVTGWTVLLKP